MTHRGWVPLLDKYCTGRHPRGGAIKSDKQLQTQITSSRPTIPRPRGSIGILGFCNSEGPLPPVDSRKHQLWHAAGQGENIVTSYECNIWATCWILWSIVLQTASVFMGTFVAWVGFSPQIISILPTIWRMWLLCVNIKHKAGILSSKGLQGAGK